jgi:predicted NAD-dependent protein-ADP-ribosyltransferase YbiA (DUF1768 family)/RNA recognition motif-containing protein
MGEVQNPKAQLLSLQTEEEIDKYFQDQAHFVLAKRKIETIDNFNGVFDFLNNEYPCKVYFEGRLYPSVFHAFQAARSDKDHERAKMSLADSMQELYELATEIEDPIDWHNKRLTVMEKCIRDKFRRDRELREKLRKTGNRDLINSYADRTASNLFWGMVDGKGENHLGQILMNVRLDIHTETELAKWIEFVLDPETDKFLLPKISLKVQRQNENLGVESLPKQPVLLLGALQTNNLVLAHPSISRIHLSIMVSKSQGPVIVDLGSKAGTFVNGERVQGHIPQPIKDKDWFGVGESSRKYTLSIDFSEVEEYLDKKHRSLQLDLKILSLKKSLTTPEEMGKNGGMVRQDTVFLSNLPNGIAEQEIRELFKQFGEIKEVRIPLRKDNGQSKGIAFVRYKDEEGASGAFKAVRIPMKDRLVKIQYAEKNKGQIVAELEREVKRERSRDREDRKDGKREHRGRKDRRKRSSVSEVDSASSRSESSSRDRRRKKRRDRSEERNGHKSSRRAKDEKSHKKNRKEESKKPKRKDSSVSKSKRKESKVSVTSSSSSDLSD